ncbi:hypothetical protein VSDG_08369 [Cytospora chrysosperma]|uniref:Uncharacterized protein n=1 Tax=Cytospora chrysosperma TaxID=252740 RepID=A0A423VGM0_CYTCH|nr:hypothetical protein VSDG_08369 [Valsa sordida]
MASSQNTQQPDAPAPSPDQPQGPQQMQARRVIVLDVYPLYRRQYVCRNRQYLEQTEPSRNAVTQLGGLHINLAHDVFYLSLDFIKCRFQVMDEITLGTYGPSDPWNVLPPARPSHIMLDARNMLLVLQETIGGDSSFHPIRALGRIHHNIILGRGTSSRSSVTELANTQAQTAQLDEIVDTWLALMHQVPTRDFVVQLPPIEFARRSRH